MQIKRRKTSGSDILKKLIQKKLTKGICCDNVNLKGENKSLKHIKKRGKTT